MKTYFILQYSMVNRKLHHFGFVPAFGYVLILSCFTGLSFYLFHTTDYAQYFYILISLAFTAKLSETGRNDFLKLCFNAKEYKLVRMLENIFTSLPFQIFLLYKQHYIAALMLFLLQLLFALSRFKTSLNLTMPTPFSKKPYEFTVGFRNAFFIFILAYFLAVIAVLVGNFNLGIGALMLVFFIVIVFHLKPENEYYVWSFAMSAKQFLFEKVKIAFLYATYLCLPVILIIGIFYYQNIVALLGFYVFGCVLLLLVILAKYAAYPYEINLPEVVIIVMCVTFPPFIIVFAIYFFIKALKKLELFLK